MADPTGEGHKGTLRLDFDHRLLLQFHGSTITSDDGLLVTACRARCTRFAVAQDARRDDSRLTTPRGIWRMSAK